MHTPSPPSTVRIYHQILQSAATESSNNGSPSTSVHTSGSSGSLNSKDSLRSKPSKNKYSLFPPPDSPGEEIALSIPTLVAARAIAPVRSVPNFKAARAAINSRDCPSPRAVSNPETSIKQAMEKLSQQAEFKREKGGWFKPLGPIKRLISKKSVVSIIPSRSERAIEEKVEHGPPIRSISSRCSDSEPQSKQEIEHLDVPENDKVADLTHVKARHKVIRRIQSEADFSPKLCTPKFSQPVDIGPPPESLPPLPEITTPNWQQVASSIHFQSFPAREGFPAREDSLFYSSGNTPEGTKIPGSIDVSEEEGSMENSRGIKTLSHISLQSSPELSFRESGIVHDRDDSSSAYNDTSYQDYPETPSPNRRVDVYSPFDPDFSDDRFTRYPYPESTQATDVSDRSSTQHRYSIMTGLVPPAIANHAYQFQGRRSVGQCRTSQTGSPLPRSRESENVPRGILDTFIESLAHNGHGSVRGDRSGARTPLKTHDELEPSNELALINKTLAAALQSGDVFDYSTTVALADFLLRSLDSITCNLWHETQKVRGQRQVLNEKKERLTHAIESAKDARAMLHEEIIALEADKAEVMRRSLKLAEVYEGQCYPF